MKLAAKILFAVFLITGTGLWWLTSGMMDNIRLRYLEGVEEALVDQSRILAAMVSRQMEAGEFAPNELGEIFHRAYESRFNSRIYHLDKTGVDLRIYITDEKGMILFDSQGKAAVGEDYSKWRDVWLTLRGQYGARSSREDPGKETSTILYVAAPILVKDDIRGVLTVAKPTTNINLFMTAAREKIKSRALAIGAVILGLSVLAVVVITRPVKRLTRYAEDIRAGRKTALPRLDRTEIGDMGRAFERMKIALENRKYVETYVQTLTHEIKSPLAAIQGAAELLEEDMPEEHRERFLGNIRTESQRIRRLVDRLLELAAIENMNALDNTESVPATDLIQKVLERLGPMLDSKGVSVTTNIQPDTVAAGNPFLLRLALSNLIQNAADFSPAKGKIVIRAARTRGMLAVEISDQGPGIPGYAADRIFEKFFSLRRPDSGRKSTGLGLNFVREIALLHKGDITLENLPAGSGSGTLARLLLPAPPGN
ncbi:MAG: two-component system sensor histidine kinase CreC [Desulfobacter sp.]|nr:MAG: two-component system sensor histidine kinase CreC [Desulfobacter sp.]